MDPDMTCRRSIKHRERCGTPPLNQLVQFNCAGRRGRKIWSALVLIPLILYSVPPSVADEYIKEIGGRPYPDNTECHPLTEGQSITIANLNDMPMIARYCWDGTPGFEGLAGEKTCQQQGLRTSKIIMPRTRRSILSDAPQPKISDGVSARLLCFLCPPDESATACRASQADKAEIDGSRFRDMGEYETSANEPQRQQQPARQPPASTLAVQPQSRSCGGYLDHIIHEYGSDSIDEAIKQWSEVLDRSNDQIQAGCTTCYPFFRDTSRQLRGLRECAAALKRENHPYEYGAPYWLYAR